jgi:hypothetical protein
MPSGGSSTGGLTASGQSLCRFSPSNNNTFLVYAWAFTSGGTYEVVAGDTITGATSTKTAIVWMVYTTSGTWAGGDAAGWLFTVSPSGTFTTGENINVGANNNVATMTTLPVASVAGQSTRSGINVNQFDSTTPETAWYTMLMPYTYNNGGIELYLQVAATSVTTGTVGWLVALRRLSSSAVDIDLFTGWSAYKTITAVDVPGTAGYIMTHSALSFSNGTEMDSIVAGDLFQICIIRDTPNDTAAGDTEVVAGEIVEQ